ncbi:MAG: cytochrome P460 family protein [Nitrococcus mobilis]|nr:cytochrome P460 family protein [Nitrococcus mobilis]
MASAGCTLQSDGGGGSGYGREATGQQLPLFGGKDSTAYAAKLWRAMQQANLVGSNRITSTPYTGQHPHGAILDTVDRPFTLDGHTGHLIVKRNYGGEGVSKQAVANDPDKWLAAITVMYRREAGYDPDNQNWFWVKYLPDGRLAQNPKGMALAGRVAKGTNQGCIACHQSAPGGDYVFNHDRLR